MRDCSSKIITRSQAVESCHKLRSEGKRIAFTSGTFDILHPGHVAYLAEARRQCDFLVVGVNSDKSVRVYKGRGRPIHTEGDRIAVIAALESVDLAFLFDEPNTNASIELLQPDLYVKGGDYEKHALSSAPIVESYGGKVLLVPSMPGKSTSGTISQIVEKFGDTKTESIELPRPREMPAVFLDRDGTLIEHIDYLHNPDRVKIYPNALAAVKRMRDAGARIIIITNQPGIGLGYFTEDDFYRVNKAILSAAYAKGAVFDRIFYCPHSLGDGCRCRKPGSALVERAVQELNIILERSFVVGDMTSDVELARLCGCKSILVRTGRGGNDGLFTATPDFIAGDLSAAATIVETALTGAAPEGRTVTDLHSSSSIIGGH